MYGEKQLNRDAGIRKVILILEGEEQLHCYWKDSNSYTGTGGRGTEKVILGTEREEVFYWDWREVNSYTVA